jgi:hypothetical protein
LAIGTMAAIGIGGALLGAGSSFLSSKSANKAAGKAADATAQTARENNALTREIFGQNQQMLNPYVQRGNAAGNTLNAMLGIGGTQQQMPQQQMPGNMGAMQPGQIGAMNPGGYNAQNPAQYRNAMLDSYPMQDGQPQQPLPAQATMQQANPMDAFRQYIANSDYGFQFGEGSNRVNSGYAGAGTLQSGAAMKDMERFRQDLQSGYRGEFMNALGNQQGVGLSGASALAGVGQNYVNTISNNNNNAGEARANALLYKGANNPLAGALGMIGGSLYGMQGMKF